AVTLGLIILATMLAAFTSNSSTGKTNSRFAEVQTNGRYAVDQLRRELQHAGFIGRTFINPANPAPANLVKAGTTATLDPGGCGAGFVTKVEEPIRGSNNAKGLGCIAAADYVANTDVVVLRRLDTTPTNTAGNPLTATRLSLRS